MPAKWTYALSLILQAAEAGAQLFTSAAESSSVPPFTESGNFYSRNYTPKEYRGAAQNWQGIQDKEGTMVFANGDGILTYDGKVWTLIETPTQSVIRSLAMEESGKIYVGALDDFGYLKRKANGQLTYESMLSLVKPDLQNMGNIWGLYTHKGLVYFEAETGLFCWNGERIQFWAWPDPHAWHKSFIWNNTLYAYQQGIGLMSSSEGHFTLAPDGELLKKSRIYGIVPLTDKKILFGTQSDGLFLYDGRHVMPFKTKADSFLATNQIYTAVLLPDSTYAIGTKRGGVIIIDKNGAIRTMITSGNLLPTNVIYHLVTDRLGNLWISSEIGIIRIELSNDITTFLQGRNLESTPNDFFRYNGILYAASNLGLYFLRNASYPERLARWEKMPEINSACWKLLLVEDNLLIASNEGLFELKGQKVNKIYDHPAYAIHQYKGEKNRILIASDHHLPSLTKSGTTWRSSPGIENLSLDNISFSEAIPGRLWITTFSQGATLITFIQRDGSINYDQGSVRSFGNADGLPEGYIKINTIDRDELFRLGSSSKLYRFNKSNSRFYPDSLFEPQHGMIAVRGYPVANENRAGAFLARTRKAEDGTRQLLLVRPSKNDSVTIKKFDISRIFESTSVLTYLDDNGVAWYGGADGIVRHALKETIPASTFETYINKIVLRGDSVFYQGIGTRADEPRFKHSSNSFRFEFTSNNYIAEEANEFQYKLKGYDDDWSAWTPENMKEYENMWEGNYEFFVRSRNYAGAVSAPYSFAFSVEPPWFRSIYAYASYFLAAVTFVWGLIRWRSYQLRQESEILRKEIANRTLEITQQNIQLAEQSEELKINAEQLKELDRLKSNFFVNISHEFRTPLTLILGPLEKFLNGERSQIRQTEIERMHRNARRLQQLINQLLELARLESGGTTITEKPSDLLYFLRVLASSFESLAEIRNIQFKIEIPPHSYTAYFDHDKVETILYNLLSNAFKFTPDGGNIVFRIGLPDAASQMVTINISDTGPGIAAEEYYKIFDRFYQVDSSSSREFEGSGIGLSLVKELVSLLNGDIEVESEPGHGTSFTTRLPMRRDLETTYPDSPPNELQQKLMNSDLSSDTPQQVTENESLIEAAPSSSEAVVLIIEDNADLRMYLKENLEDEFQIVMAENGREGLECAVSNIPDLILSDMMMPGMDGFTLCTHIRRDERTSHIPFILLTARTTIESKLAGLELGADEYMTKPFNIKELKVRIRNLLQQRETLRKNFSRKLTLQPRNISVTSVDERFLNNALAIVESHLADNQFSVEGFATEIGMSRKNLLRKIKALTDQSVNEFIRNLRLQRASQLILASSGSISEIAYQVGFNNLSYFSKCFKELFGMLPHEYSSKKDASN